MRRTEKTVAGKVTQEQFSFVDETHWTKRISVSAVLAYAIAYAMANSEDFLTFVDVKNK